MSQELFYTSAPKGLRPGSQGFCTVAATRGLSAALTEKLESLSGYRPLFPPHDARAGLNPVAFAHVRISAGGRTYTVVSRIGPAGLDYTERPNKFAHHVVLDAAELPAGGPAWLLRQRGFLESRWDGQVQVLSAGRLPPRGDVAPDVCRNWQTLTGDAGWAGVLAEAFQADPTRLVYLIFEPGMDVLPLLAESLALLPPEQRWEVTFSTYFTGLPQGAQCLWRCVPHGSPEAKGARQFPNALMLDVGDELGAARGGALVARARGQAYVPPPLPGKGAEWPNQWGENGIGEKTPRTEKLNSSHYHKTVAGAIPFQESSGAILPSSPPPLNQPPLIYPRDSKKPLLFGLGIGAVGGTAITLIILLAYTSFRRDGITLSFQRGKEAEKAEADSVKAPLVREMVKGVPEKGEIQDLSNQLREFKEKNQELTQQLAQSKEHMNGLVDQLVEAKIRGEILKKQFDRWKSAVPASKVADPQKKVENAPDNVKGQGKIETIADNLWLPTRGERAEPVTLKVPTDSSKSTLELLGLQSKTLDGYDLVRQQDRSSLVVSLRKKGTKDNLPIARFSLDGAKLQFRWEKPDLEKIEKEELSLARRIIRNSVLEVKHPDLDKPVLVGLILHPPRPTSLTFDFTKNNPIKRSLKDDLAGAETSPLNPLFVSSATSEIILSTAGTAMEGNLIKAVLGGEVALRIENSKNDDEVSLVAEWKGKHQPPPKLVVKNLVLYMKVAGRNVEVLRLGKK